VIPGEVGNFFTRVVVTKRMKGLNDGIIIGRWIMTTIPCYNGRSSSNNEEWRSTTGRNRCSRSSHVVIGVDSVVQGWVLIKNNNNTSTSLVVDLLRVASTLARVKKNERKNYETLRRSRSGIKS